jgi:hypothetical protein
MVTSMTQVVTLMGKPRLIEVDLMFHCLNIKKKISSWFFLKKKPNYYYSSELLLDLSNRLGHIVITPIQFNLKLKLSKKLARKVSRLSIGAELMTLSKSSYALPFFYVKKTSCDFFKKSRTTSSYNLVQSNQVLTASTFYFISLRLLY